MVSIVLGTRPELIKLAPVMHEFILEKIPFRIIHTEQYYTEALDHQFFEELSLPTPSVHLGVGSQ
ncbi:hypothetical protein [Pajaroellobacter abortibovis]|uniref:hypothetical protein n=1 Tax=Pajaroellobacter abortibovis TaxID=1882918 RepID=UPI0009FA3746|nr:hypothetical protein [Pajaroellobacter abortibovis]